MLQAEEMESEADNHPSAKRMAVIAFLNQNIVIGCIFGPFSVLLGAVEIKLGIGRELSSLAVGAVNLSSAICAPLVGVLVARFSLRLVLIAGSILSIAGFTLLLLSTNYAEYLIAYGLLIGPGMAAGVILPSTLVTRWFSKNRGKALGLATAPILTAAVPIISAYMIHAHGLQAAYGALIALSFVTLIANLFIIDRPPGSQTDVPAAHGVPAGAKGMSMGELLKKPSFWAMSLGYGASAAGAMIFGAHAVPMVRSWGMSATLGATLVSTMFLSGILGALVFGWIADRLGGCLSLGILVFDECVFCLAMLLHPPFILLAVLFGLYGLHAAGAVPVFSLALSESFGRESFSRAYGLVSLLMLPITVLAVPVAALIVTNTGSYAGAILTEAVFLGLAAVLTFTNLRRPPKILAGA